MRTKDILYPGMYQENRKLLETLKAQLTQERFMLCLGAGVSISAKLPNWYGLLAKVTAQILPLQENLSRDITTESIKNDNGDSIKKSYLLDLKNFYKNLQWDEEFLDKMEYCFEGKYSDVFAGINVLESAEYIRNYIEEEIISSGRVSRCTTFDDIEHEIDYYMNKLIQEACKTDIDISSQNEEIQNSTLGAVVRLMEGKGKNKINNVITYNYDNLLETYLRNICHYPPKSIHSIIKKDSIEYFNAGHEWNIYHVHGRVPVIEYPGEEMSDSVVLTESDYYQEEQINYSWVNIVQSYAIASSNLIFIGFSGADYNFRRIIKYVEKDKMKTYSHYIFFAVDDIVKAVFQNGDKTKTVTDDMINRMNNPNTDEFAFEKLLINHLIYAQTLYWNNHQMKVIWSSLAELPENLEYLRS